jgi:hypothetical protein
MSLGGVRGLGGPFLRRLPKLTLFKVGTTLRAVGRFRHYSAGARGRLPDYSGTKQRSDSETALSLPMQSTV